MSQKLFKFKSNKKLVEYFLIAYFNNFDSAVGVPLSSQLIINIFLYVLHTKFSFAKLNDINYIGNASPSCHLTVKSQQYKQTYKVQN